MKLYNINQLNNNTLNKLLNFNKLSFNLKHIIIRGIGIHHIIFT